MKEKNILITFVGISFFLSILLSLVIGLTGGHESSFIALRFATMPIPAITVLIMGSAFSAPLTELDWKRLPVRWLPMALLLIPAVIHVICIPLIANLNNNSLPWQLWLTQPERGLFHAPDNFGWGTLTPGGLIFKISINAIAGVVIVSALAFLEEIGWRAWMLPRLIEKYNVRQGILIGSLIWALWHVPFMLSGILWVKDVPTHLLALMDPFGIFGAGLIISWFWIKTKSIWIVSLAHGALNHWGQYAFKYMGDGATDPPFQQVWLFAGVNGSLFVTGLIIFITIKNKKASGMAETAGAHHKNV